MGLFKDIRTVTKQAKEIDKTFDPGKQARDATARMAALNQQFAQTNAALAAPPEDCDTATAQIVAVGPSSGMLNMDPIVPLELLVQFSGLPPRPASISAVVPMTQLGRLQPGAQLTVRVSRSDPSAIAVIWS